MAGIIGRKVGVTQIYDRDDSLISVTVVEAGPCAVLQVKSEDRDGYRAIRLGFQDLPAGALNRPDQGLFDRTGLSAKRVLREIRLDEGDAPKVGDIIDVGIFEVGGRVHVTGTSKGKGFAGGVKRHHFKGGPRSHGQSDRHRAPGSIGSSSYPSRVFKGLRMAGRMGNRRVTTKGLSVVRVDKERNLLFLKGAVPGARGGTILIRKAG